MSILISSEVQENRLLSKSEPSVYRLAETVLIPCYMCGENFIEIFKKDSEFTKFNCFDCWEI